MTTQKTFKRRVRARMAKTGEAYTTARTQLVRKADARTAERAAAGNGAAALERTPADARRTPDVELPASDASLRQRTGHGWEHWFRLLDKWGANERSHTEIARWLREDQGVDGWWAQSITGGYERARGMRAKHQFAKGFAVSANRTVDVSLDRLMSAFTHSSTRRRWLQDAPLRSLRRRQTKAANALVFDWPDPPSRVTAWFVSKGDAKTTVTVEHSRLPDSETAERFKASWRERLTTLKGLLEKD